MTGETDPSRLIAGMKPVLHDGEYVFCTLGDPSGASLEEAIGFFREDEGMTLILAREKADALGLAYDYIAAWVSLTIHSSLNAVGLTAAISSALSESGISCNVVAAYHHDHLFVARDEAGRAMAVLKRLARAS
ncbi:MAG: ACT domain-containing protein [Castellaniella sp.]|uniref:ACT domain-containing protein n=1 Tax=Castellaniella sp. TaxID=1955812 RepID=UPI003A8A7E9E